MTYELLSPIPCALAHKDGALRKNAKCQLANIIEKLVNVVPRLQAPPQNTVYIIDGMAVVQMTKSCGATTFGERCRVLQHLLFAPVHSIVLTAFTSFSTSALRCQSKLASDQREAHQVG